MVRKPIEIAALFLILLVWFGTIQYRDMFQPDEGRYAEIPGRSGTLACQGEFQTRPTSGR